MSSSALRARPLRGLRPRSGKKLVEKNSSLLFQKKFQLLKIKLNFFKSKLFFIVFTPSFFGPFSFNKWPRCGIARKLPAKMRFFFFSGGQALCPQGRCAAGRFAAFGREADNIFQKNLLDFSKKSFKISKIKFLKFLNFLIFWNFMKFLNFWTLKISTTTKSWEIKILP